MTTTPIAKLMLGLLGSGSEFERSIIHERQAESIARAKRAGYTKVELKRSLTNRLAQAREWVDAGVPKAKVVRRLDIGRTIL